MYTATPALPSPLDTWDIAYFVSQDPDGRFEGTAELHLRRRSLYKTLFTQLQVDEGSAFRELRLRCNAWITDWYARPDTGTAGLDMWSKGWDRQ
jgi:hypothetical protein